MKRSDKLKLIIEDLINNYKQDAKLSIIEFFSKLMAYITTLIIFIAIISGSIIFMSIALAYYINDLFSSEFIGFLCISIIYLLILLIIKTIIHKKKNPLLIHMYIRMFVKLFFDEKEN